MTLARTTTRWWAATTTQAVWSCKPQWARQSALPPPPTRIPGGEATSRSGALPAACALHVLAPGASPSVSPWCLACLPAQEDRPLQAHLDRVERELEDVGTALRVAKQLPHSPARVRAGQEREASPLGFSACLAGGEHRHARSERCGACMWPRGAVRVWGSSGAALPAHIASYPFRVEVHSSISWKL